MGNDTTNDVQDAARVRTRARTLSRAGWLAEAIDLLRDAADGAHGDDAGIRFDLAKALLAAGRIAEAEAVRLPGAEP